VNFHPTEGTNKSTKHGHSLHSIPFNSTPSLSSVSQSASNGISRLSCSFFPTSLFLIFSNSRRFSLLFSLFSLVVYFFFSMVYGYGYGLPQVWCCGNNHFNFFTEGQINYHHCSGAFPLGLLHRIIQYITVLRYTYVGTVLWTAPKKLALAIAPLPLYPLPCRCSRCIIPNSKRVSGVRSGDAVRSRIALIDANR
jgi:hypothetical protein